jgi:hypothetical protein
MKILAYNITYIIWVFLIQTLSMTHKIIFQSMIYMSSLIRIPFDMYNAPRSQLSQTLFDSTIN